MGNNKENQLITDLKKVYPTGVIEGNLTQDKNLYYKIRSLASKRNLDIVVYLEKLGYTLENRRVEYTEKELLAKLEEIFVDKKYNNITDIYKQDYNLYNQLNYYSKMEGLSSEAYLRKNKFYKVNKEIGNNKTKGIDNATLNKLRYEYDTNMSDIATLFNTTRQNIDSRSKNIKRAVPWWHNEPFTYDEELLICKVIESKEHYYDNNDIHIRIYNGKTNIADIIILYINTANYVKCISELSSVVVEKINEYHFDKYRKADMEILKELEHDLENQLGNIIIVENDEEECIKLLKNELTSRIITRAKYINMPLDEYVKYLGYALDNSQGKRYSDNDIKNLLLQYQNNEGYIKIPIGTKDYIRIFRLANNRGFSSMGDFIKSLGLKYIRTTDKEIIQNKYREQLANYIVYENKVYLPSECPLYGNLNAYGVRNEKTLNETIEMLGYVRLNKDDLPLNYIPYDWKVIELNKGKSWYSLDTVLEILNQLSDDDGTVKVYENSAIYNRLCRIAVIRSNTPKQLVTELGFHYSFFMGDEPVNDEMLIDFKLKKLDKIQAELKSSTSVREKSSRSQLLVKELKSLYSNKCQLCDFTREKHYVPVIKTSDGTYYIEMHHIVPISDVKLYEDETNYEIDSYKNGIVVCPYHHKYLHFYKGGTKILIKKDGKLYFEFSDGTLLEVYTNYHLKENCK